MKSRLALFLLFAAALTAMAPALSLAERPANYLVLKGGVYSPSETYDFGNVHFDTEDGFVVEGAFGHYFLPFLALELGGGYLESNASPAGQPGESKLEAFPAVLTGKLLLPLGPVEPYGEFGIGLYITSLEVPGNPGNINDTTKGTFVYHAGGGVNLDLGSDIILGGEVRYLWGEQSFAGREVRLDGLTVTGSLGFRY